MKFLHSDHDNSLELSLDDVFIVPSYFEGVSRSSVDLSAVDFVGGCHPVVSANMNAVTGKRLAETMARNGGLGVLPQDMSNETLTRIVSYIKSASPNFDTALTVSPNSSLREVQGIIRKRNHGAVVVVDENRMPVGVVTLADLRERDQYSAAEDIMSSDLIVSDITMSPEDSFLRMHEARVRVSPVVDAKGVLVGITTKADCVRRMLFKPAVDSKGRLMVAAAVGISANAATQAKFLVDLGVDAIVLDTAHGHQRRMLEAIEATRKACGDIPIIAGNVCTAEGTQALISAGADVVKVNVGPGAMCTTRMQTGVGRPTFSAVRACADAARKLGKHVWGDGGVKHPRDVALYLAAGASRVMVGTMLCGTYESPGDLKQDANGFWFKENYGMASARAVRDRSSDLNPFQQAQKELFREGISNSKIYLAPGRESVADILVEIYTGVQSSFTYVGATSIPQFQEKAVVGIQTRAGFIEGTPHGKVRNG